MSVLSLSSVGQAFSRYHRPQLRLGRRDEHRYQNEPTDKGNEAHDQFQHRSLSLPFGSRSDFSLLRPTTRLLELASVGDVRGP